MDLIDAYNINTKGKLLIVSVDHKQDTLILKPPAICKSNFCAFFRDNFLNKAPGDHPQKCILLYLELFAAGGVFRVYIIEMNIKNAFLRAVAHRPFFKRSFSHQGKFDCALFTEFEFPNADTWHALWYFCTSILCCYTPGCFPKFLCFYVDLILPTTTLYSSPIPKTLSRFCFLLVSQLSLFTIYTWPMTFVLSLCVFPFHLMLESKTLIWFCYFYI